MKNLTIATWNINSVRLRIEHVLRFLREEAPDILCLQETKCPDDRFPSAPFADAGYPHVEMFGQKGYHGVATVSRLRLDGRASRDFCGRGDARHLAVTTTGGGAFAPVTVHNFYVPAGGDEPDPDTNPKFAHKLQFLDELKECFSNGALAATDRHVLVGDLNVAPHENDVWSHKQLLRVVSHTPIEVEKLSLAQASARWTDVVRQHIPVERKQFTWWSYRSPNWRASNRGRRLDHIWSSPALEGRSRAVTVLEAARDWQRPSDHVPVIAAFDAS